MKANEFEASKHQRQVVNRFNTFIHDGDANFEKDIAGRLQTEASKSNKKEKDATETTGAIEEPPSVKKPQKPKKSKNVATDLKTRIHCSEYQLAEDQGVDWKHRFKVTWTATTTPGFSATLKVLIFDTFE